MNCSLSGSPVHGIFQARVLEWIAISFSRGSSWARDRTWVSRIVGRRFTVWATREVLCFKCMQFILWNLIPMKLLLRLYFIFICGCAGSPLLHAGWVGAILLLRHTGSQGAAFRACGIFLDQRLNLCPPHWQGRFLTCGSPGKSEVVILELHTLSALSSQL